MGASVRELRVKIIVFKHDRVAAGTGIRRDGTGQDGRTGLGTKTRSTFPFRVDHWA